MSKIEYEISKAGNVTIKVVDIIGTPISELKNNHHKAGKYLANIDSRKFLPGKYYYKIYLSDEQANGKPTSENNLISSGQIKVEI